ncbi:MAG TPA: hypothetical protein VD993_19835 [Chitinophagaceae bacterium]|nr:hypothetical protein [Chitinophagaceae bacterium]
MKSLRSLLVLLTPMLLFLSCSKEKSLERGNNNVNSQWEFKEGSNQFKGPVDTAFIVSLGQAKGLILEGTSDDGTGLLTIAISGFNTTAPATYKTPNVQFGYVKASGIVYQSDLTAVDQFTVQVTHVDSASVSGTFSGKVKDSLGADKTITDGKFSARLNNSTNPAPTNGQLTFWSKQGCSGGGPITVKLSNNQTGSISTFSAAAPTCAAAGTASFTVPAGNYLYTAYCTGDTIVKTITVTASQCKIEEVVFGSGPAPTGQATFWAKSSCTAGGNITVKLHNNQTGTISTFTPTAPANCSTAGNANFTLPQGVYGWVAYCGGDSVTGNVVVTASGCAKTEVVFQSGTGAQYTLVSTGGNCANFQPQGTYTAGVALDNTNKVVVQVNVTALGSYSITTNNVNGYSFSASGNFTTLGTQNVTLQGVGTPVVGGTNNFTTTAGTSNCGFAITVVPGTPGASFNWSFTQGTRNLQGPVTDAYFDDDWLGFGKSLDIYGEIPGTDTIFNLYIQFPASATAPIPGTYITNPDPLSNNTSDFLMYDDNDFVYRAKDITSPPSNTNVKMTIIITSYDPTTKIVKGTFSGQCWNTANQVVNITNGKFEAEVIF